MERRAKTPLSFRWKRWAAGAAGLLAAYTVAGFWLVPWVIQDQVPKLGRSVLARQASVGAVRFNPYTLRLQLQDLRLAEADGAPLLAIGALAVEMQWRSLVRRAWSFAEIRIGAPSVHLTIAPDGQFNLAALVATLAKRPSQPSAAPGLPRLIIERFALEQGQVVWNDRQAGYANNFAPIDLALANFSTLPQQQDAYTFSAETARGGRIGLKGELSVNPIGGKGELTLSDISLPELAVYLKPYAQGLTVAGGKLGATVPYRFAYGAGKFEASLERAKVALRELALAQDAAGPALHLSAGAAELQWTLALEHAGAGLQLRVADAALSLADLALGSGAQTPLTLRHLGFIDGRFDLAARQASLGRLYAEGGQLQLTRDRKGQLNLAQLRPRFGAAGAAPAARGAASAPPWSAVVRRVELSRFGAAIEDQGSGIKVHVQDLALNLQDVNSDLTQAVRFDAGLSVREGGQLAAQGSVVPASLALQAEVAVKRLALKPLQALLDQHVALKIAGGSVSAQGRLTAGAGAAKRLGLRYVGGFQVDGLALNDLDGDLFAGWRSVAAGRLDAGLNPDRLDIAELRVVEPVAALVIEEDRSINATRLRLRAPSSGGTAAAPVASPAAAAPAALFPVNIRRIRVQNGKLDFADLSLLPQFSAKIYELNGVVNGLSSRRDSRSQIELDGRVDEFGLARIRGELNPFAPSNNTDVSVVFRNVNLVPASPYTAKFAGYKIAEGRISLDLGYKVRDGQLEGNNQIVIDQLMLGERVDSPDALKLPVQLAIAILKDSEGRIDLGLPVSGNLNEPKFSFGAVIWKALTEFLGRIVTAPFRALGRLLGISGEALEAISFDPGKATLLPPEREKLQQIAQLLAKRAQLKLTVPGQYGEAADGAALRERAVRLELARRAGVKLEAGEEPGPVDLSDGAVRDAVKELYGERFGRDELERQKKAAEGAAPAGAPLPLWQRLGKRIQGEPQVADASAFYRALLERLNAQQPLAADALTRLGAQRASAILAALQEAGVDAASAVVAAPEGVGSEPGKPVPLKLGLVPK